MLPDHDTLHVPQYEPQEALLREYCKNNPVPALSAPPGWSSSVAGMAWESQDLLERHINHLKKEECAEIFDACAGYIATGKSLPELDQSSFPLPLLKDKLAAIRKSLHDDLGIAILRGLDPLPGSMREIFVAFAGLASHVSNRRGGQSGDKTIVHIIDLTSSSGHTVLPGPYRNSPLSFHTDPVADVVAMFVVQASAKGGQGIFCPVASICSELAATRPDLLEELAKPEWPFDRPPDGVGAFYRRPLLFPNETTAAPEMIFSRGALISSPQGFRPAGLPSLTLRQNVALDAVHFAASSKALRLEYQPGDVLFFNNRRVLHGREAFEDGGGASGNRHLLRLWLRDEDLAGTPPPPLNRLWEERLVAPRSGEEAGEAAWPLAPHIA